MPPNRRHRFKSLNSGFTYIEMLITISIMAITAAIAVPSYICLRPRMELKEAARNLMADMEYARIQALKRKIPIAVAFNPTTNSYRIIDSGGDDDWTDGDETVYKKVDITTFGPILFGSAHDHRPGATSTPKDGISFGGNRVIFNPDSTGSSGTAYIENSDGDTMAVSSTSCAGHIKIYWAFGEGSAWSG